MTAIAANHPLTSTQPLASRNTTEEIWDVAIVGAGMAGLTCAKQLQQRGYRVVVVEKSRGLGGRLATRRLPDAWADHGIRCLQAQGDQTRSLIQELVQQQQIHLWQRQVWQWQGKQTWSLDGDAAARYVSGEGLTVAAKHLGRGLEILKGQRVVAIAPCDIQRPNSSIPGQPWQLILEPLQGEVSQTVVARAIVLAIPAPQAAALLEPLSQQGIAQEIWEQVHRVEYDPCLTAIATYSDESVDMTQLPWGGLAFPSSNAIAWVGLEHRKRFSSPQTDTLGQDQPPYVVVLQSSADFARQHLETQNLQSVGEQLLQFAGESIAPWLAKPQLLQVHRWRYAFVSNPINENYLQASSAPPLICCGDWCGGRFVEDAMRSGALAAIALSTQLSS